MTNHRVTEESDTPPTLLASAMLQRPDGSGGWLPVQRAVYTYYTGWLPDGMDPDNEPDNDPNGRLGDLKLVVSVPPTPGRVHFLTG